MHLEIMEFITQAFGGAVSLVERLISGIPGANSAIVWAAFVTLSVGFLIVPIRGSGASDLADAKAAYRSSQLKSRRQQAKAVNNVTPSRSKVK